MARDLIEEVHRVREAYAERFNFDLDAIARDIMERQDRGEFNVVYRAPRKPRKTLKRSPRGRMQKSA